jgi:hypothetical protein
MQMYPRLVSLPLYPAMTDEQVDYVIESVKQIIEAAHKKPQIVVTAETFRDR